MTSLDRRTFLFGAAGVLAAGRWQPGRDPAGSGALAELARDLRGPLLVPGRPGYEVARRVFNDRYAGVRPRAVARCLDARDVVQVVRWSARRGVRIAARSGGHSYAGYSTLRDGVVCDLGGLAGSHFDRARGLVTIGAGARLDQVNRALAAHGAMLPAGSCPTVGIAGLALGGGVGFAARRFGLTCDQLVAVDVVTADGRVRRCDARHDPDLYWASRGGGGGSLGVATRLVFRVHRAPTVAYAFVRWPWQRLHDVVATWQRLAPHAPDALFSVIALETQAEVPRVRLLAQLHGSEATLRRLLAPLLAIDGAHVSIASGSYLDVYDRFAGCLHLSAAQCRVEPAGVIGHDAFVASSGYASRPLTAAQIRAFGLAIERRQAQAAHGSGAILLDAYGGAIGRVPVGATAFAHRDALFSAQQLAYWYRSSDGPLALRWLRRTRHDLAGALHGSYVNYADPELPGYARAYWGANLPRLAAIKRRYDPDDVFRFAQAIPARA